jgi:hypothetical protein
VVLLRNPVDVFFSHATRHWRSSAFVRANPNGTQESALFGVAVASFLANNRTWLGDLVAPASTLATRSFPEFDTAKLEAMAQRIRDEWPRYRLEAEGAVASIRAGHIVASKLNTAAMHCRPAGVVRHWLTRFPIEQFLFVVPEVLKEPAKRKEVLEEVCIYVNVILYGYMCVSRALAIRGC